MNTPILTPRAHSTPIAQLLRAASAQPEPMRLVALGITIHHFTDPVTRAIDIDLPAIHRGTTMLTKQVLELLAHGADLASLQGILRDPDRQAMPDGRAVADLCGPDWPIVEALASARIDAALADAEVYGETAILRLAATRAVAPSQPWWGTTEWTAVVNAWARRTGRRESIRRAMLEAPEAVDATLLASALCGLDRSM
jgi:hypothetical protein